MFSILIFSLVTIKLMCRSVVQG